MRAVALLLVAPFLTLVSALAPQHVHEPGPGHHHAVAHSHFEPHEAGGHHAGALEIEHDEAGEQVVWLDGVALHESPYQAVHVLPVLGLINSLAAVVSRWTATPFEDSARVHGPPKRSHLFRGPPASLLS